MPDVTQTSSTFPIMFTVIGIFIAVIFVVIIVTVIANVRKVRRSGHNPLTLQSELATRLLDSEVLSKDVSTEQRLSELDDLLARAVISPEEHAAARSEALRAR